MEISGSNKQSTTIERTKPSYNIAEMKENSDKMILESQLKVSSQDGPTVMSLLLRTAIEEINKQIPSSNEDNTDESTRTIQKAYESNLDFSPKATADRIINGATSFFNAYKEQNTDLSEEEALTQFMGVIRSGIDTGFGQARDVLESLSVLKGDIANDIDSTYDTVQTGLAEFNEKILTVIKENTTN